MRKSYLDADGQDEVDQRDVHVLDGDEAQSDEAVLVRGLDVLEQRSEEVHAAHDLHEADGAEQETVLLHFLLDVLKELLDGN